MAPPTALLAIAAFCAALVAAHARAPNANCDLLYNGESLSASSWDSFLNVSIYAGNLRDDTPPGQVYLTLTTDQVTALNPVSPSDYVDVQLDTGASTLQLVITDAFRRYEEDMISSTEATTINIETTLTCSDGNSPIFVFRITVEDVNNHAPEFEWSSREYELPMPLPSGIDLSCIMGVIYVKDIDISNSMISVEFDPEGAQLFQAEATYEGNRNYAVRITSRTAIELTETSSFTMIAMDNGVPQKSSAPATITIKVNQETSPPTAPKFRQPALHETVRTDDIVPGNQIASVTISEGYDTDVDVTFTTLDDEGLTPSKDQFTVKVTQGGSAGTATVTLSWASGVTSEDIEDLKYALIVVEAKRDRGLSAAQTATTVIHLSLPGLEDRPTTACPTPEPTTQCPEPPPCICTTTTSEPTTQCPEPTPCICTTTTLEPTTQCPEPTPCVCTTTTLEPTTQCPEPTPCVCTTTTLEPTTQCPEPAPCNCTISTSTADPTTACPEPVPCTTATPDPTTQCPDPAPCDCTSSTSSTTLDSSDSSTTPGSSTWPSSCPTDPTWPTTPYPTCSSSDDTEPCICPAPSQCTTDETTSPGCPTDCSQCTTTEVPPTSSDTGSPTVSTDSPTSSPSSSPTSPDTGSPTDATECPGCSSSSPTTSFTSPDTSSLTSSTECPGCSTSSPTSSQTSPDTGSPTGSTEYPGCSTSSPTSSPTSPDTGSTTDSTECPGCATSTSSPTSDMSSTTDSTECPGCATSSSTSSPTSPDTGSPTGSTQCPECPTTCPTSSPTSPTTDSPTGSTQCPVCPTTCTPCEPCPTASPTSTTTALPPGPPIEFEQPRYSLTVASDYQGDLLDLRLKDSAAADGDTLVCRLDAAEAVSSWVEASAVGSSACRLAAAVSLPAGSYSFAVVASLAGTSSSATAQVALGVSAAVWCNASSSAGFSHALMVAALAENPPSPQRVVPPAELPEGALCSFSASVDPARYTEWVTVDAATGEVLVRDLDYEQVASLVIWLQVSCDPDHQQRRRSSRDLPTKDQPNWPHELLFDETKMSVLLQIEDINDNAPVFTAGDRLVVGYPTGDLLERVQPGPVVTLTATDADEGVNAELRYGLDAAGGARFSVQPVTGAVYLRADAGGLPPGGAAFTATVADLAGAPGALTDSMQVLVKPLERDELVLVMRVAGALPEDADTVVRNLSAATGLSVRLLRAYAAPAEGARAGRGGVRAAGAAEAGAALALMLYALDDQEALVNVEAFQKVLSSSEVQLPWEVSKVENLPPEPEEQAPADVTGYMAAIIALAVLIAVAVVAVGAGYYFYFRPRIGIQKKKDGYTEFTSDADKPSPLESQIPQITTTVQPNISTVSEIIDPVNSLTVENNIQSNGVLAPGTDDDWPRKRSMNIRGGPDDYDIEAHGGARRSESSDSLDGDGAQAESEQRKSSLDGDEANAEAERRKSTVHFNENVECIEVERL